MSGEKTVQMPQVPRPDPKNITQISVSNFKSIVGEQSIDIKPLTILAGANSSGKSSMMQPLLLLKQTLEAPYDPGALLLDGPNVKFSQAEQLLARGQDGQVADKFSVGIMQGEDQGIETFLKKGDDAIFRVNKTIYRTVISEYCIHDNMSLLDLNREILSFFRKIVADLGGKLQHSKNIEWLESSVEALNKVTNTLVEIIQKSNQYPLTFSRNRCFLDYSFNSVAVSSIPDFPFYILHGIIGDLHHILHLPGFRGNPQRTYPLIPLGQNFTNFSGTFENYTASVIASWQRSNNEQKLALLNRDLTRLGLTNKIVAQQVSGAHIELLVNRLVHGQDGAEDLVNIADVGFGVSQALPVVVALHAAEPGQLVYIEQPEIHLHPRAQCAIAEVLADAALAGKRVVIETHSDLVLSSIQTRVAEGKLPPELVKLHWFEQQLDGSTKITSADLDKAGAFGDWPEDFHTVILSAENRYLNAAEAQLLGE